LTDNLESLVFIALGEASMCWSDIDKAGTFESSRCLDVGRRLIVEINSVLKPRTSEEMGSAGLQHTTPPAQNTAGVFDDCL
jgi:hypothetical protein